MADDVLESAQVKTTLLVACDTTGDISLQSFPRLASCLREVNLDLTRILTWKVFVICPTDCERSMWFVLKSFINPQDQTAMERQSYKQC